MTNSITERNHSSQGETRLRVILTCNYSPWSRYSGGGQLSTHQLAKEFALLGHDVHVVYTKAPFDKISVPEDIPYHIHWALFFALQSDSSSVFRPFNALSVAHCVSKLCHKNHNVVIHSQGEEGVLIPWVCPNTPWVLTPRYPKYPKKLLGKNFRDSFLPLEWLVSTKYMLLRKFARNADMVCPTSHATAQMIERALLLPSQKIRVIPNGIHPAFTQVNRELITTNAPIIFYGRVEFSKGIDTLIDAYIEIRPPNPLLIIGNGSLLQKMKQRIQSAKLEDCVHFKDWQQPHEIARLLSKASLAVLASREESFGNAIAEVIAAGTPLISTTAGSIPSTAKRTLVKLVEPGNVEALVNAIKEALSDPSSSETKAQKAQCDILERFTWSKTASMFLDVYTHIQRSGTDND